MNAAPYVLLAGAVTTALLALVAEAMDRPDRGALLLLGAMLVFIALAVLAEYGGPAMSHLLARYRRRH